MEESRRDPATILRSLVKQLCLMSPRDGSLLSFPDPVLSIYHHRKHNANLSDLLTIEESKNLLMRLSVGFLRTIIVIDGLDECSTKAQATLINVIEAVVSSPSRKPTKVFISSRDEGNLRHKFSESPNICLQECKNSSDISIYIKSEVRVCINAKRILEGEVSSDLEQRIIRALTDGAHGMYVYFHSLLVLLNLVYILKFVSCLGFCGFGTRL